MNLQPYLVLTLVLISFASCSDPEVPGGEVTVMNHILDRDYNSFTVDQLSTAQGPTAYHVTLKPNQKATLPYKNIRSMRFSRQYKDYAMLYVVECPPGVNKKITIKLIDVHTNKLAGGCKLVKRGKQENGAWVKWE